MNCLFKGSRLIVFVIILSVISGCAMQPAPRPVTDLTMRYTGTGYSALPPQGKDWYIKRHSPNIVVFNKVSVENMDIYPTFTESYQTFGAGVRVMKPEAKKVDSSAEFPEAIEQLFNNFHGGVGSRFRLISLKVAPFGPQGSYCSLIDLVQEERDNPIAPGVVLEITVYGFTCLDISSKFMIQVVYSERKTKGSESMLDDALKREAEGFLKDVIFTPLSDSQVE